MFTDTPYAFLLADQRHRELVAEAEQHRLGRLARAARRARPPARPRPAPPAAPDGPGPSARREPARDRRGLVPR